MTRWATFAVAALATIAMTVLASRFLPSLDLSRAPLADIAPWRGETAPRLARRVVLIVVDGLRADVADSMPMLSTLRARGAAGVARAELPTLSLPGYVAIATGVLPRFSGVRTNEWRGRIAIDSLPDRVVAAGGRVALASDRARLPELFGLPWEPALPVAATRSEDLLIVIPTALDRAGHDHGGASGAYRATAREIDRELVRILAGYDLERDAVVVTSDHGHLDRGGHGGEDDQMTAVPLVLAGAGVRRGVMLGPATHADIAPTIAALLGIPAPGHGAGRRLSEALVVALRGDARVETVSRAHATIARADTQRIESGRPWRLAIAAAVWLGLVAGFLRARLRIERTAVAIALLPIGIVAIAITLLPLPLSPPHVPGDRWSLALELSPYLGATGMRGSNPDFVLTALGASDFKFYRPFGNEGASWASANTQQRMVLHLVFDSTKPAMGERIELFRNGTQLTKTTSSPPAMNQQVALGGSDDFMIGNSQGSNRSIGGTIFYVAYYDVALTAAEITTNAMRLAADDDH